MKKAILYLVIFIAVQFLIGMLVPLLRDYTTLLSSFDNTESLILATSVINILIIICFAVFRFTPLSRHYLQTRQWQVFFWTIIAALGTIIPSMWIQEKLPPLPNVVEQEMLSVMLNKWGYVAVGLLAPIAEEMVFRGAILRELLVWQKSKLDRPSTFLGNHWFPITVSALLFMLVHANPAQMPHAFVVGLLLGWMYYRTGSILPGIAYHWVNNTVAYVLTNLYPAPDIKLIDLYGGSETKVLLSVLFSLIIFIPALLQLNAKMKRT